MRMWGVTETGVSDAVVDLVRTSTVLWQGRAIQAGLTVMAAYLWRGDFMSIFRPAEQSTLNPPSPTLKRVISPRNQDPVDGCVSVLNMKLIELLKIAKLHNKVDSSSMIEVTRDGEWFKISTCNNIALGYSLHRLLSSYELVTGDWEGEVFFVVNLGALQKFEKALQAFTLSFNEFSSFWKQLTGIDVPPNTFAFQEKTKKELFPDEAPKALREIGDNAKFILFDQMSITLPNNGYEKFVKGQIELVYKKMCDIRADQYVQEDLTSDEKCKKLFKARVALVKSFAQGVVEFQTLVKSSLEELSQQESICSPPTPAFVPYSLNKYDHLRELHTLNEYYFAMLTKIYRALTQNERKLGSGTDKQGLKTVNYIVPLPPRDEKTRFFLQHSVGEMKQVQFFPYYGASPSAEFMRQTYLDKDTKPIF